MRKLTLLFVLVTQFACHSVSTPESELSCAPEKFEDRAVLVLTTNYETSSVDLFHPDCPNEVRKNLVVASGDAVLRKVGKLPIILNRGAESNLMVLNEELDVVSQIILSNCGPHDVVALTQDELLVSCYESTSLQKVVLSDERSEPILDLTEYAGADGYPEMDALAADANYIYLTLQNLDRRNNWIPEKPGTLLVFDKDTLELEREITLPCDNPYTSLVFRDNSTIWLGCAGTWSGDHRDSGIMSLNLETWTASTVFDGAVLNGRPTALDTGETVLPFAVSATPSGESAWDVASMQVVQLDNGGAQTVYTQPGFSLGGIRNWSNTKLLIAQRTYDSQSGVLLLDLERLEVDSRWETGLLPSHFIVSD